ncbi:TetR/AcrR family transcriptional regulator [Demequina sp.]|uniref:TetR/AcrR family transcriptional regulator n=1 Tax=Demequina sp. TaxID=2050685 RepID=UPI0025BF03A2|nr:TetR/AcrR family transcriptional regulator [Demequina sp.]
MSTLTASDWVLAAARRLASHGVDQVRVEPLAQSLGVSKGSFYWHFASREALLAGVLEMWESQGTEAIIAAVDATAGPPPARVHALITHTFGQPEHDGIELGIRAWARHDPLAAATAARVDKRRIGYVTGLLSECGIDAGVARTRAEFMYRTLIGEFVLRSHGHDPLPPGTLKRLGDTLVLPPS